MPAAIYISTGSFLLALVAFVLARRDRQSDKTVAQLADLRLQVEGLKSRVADLEKQNSDLRQENIELMRKLTMGLSCPFQDSPTDDGLERRRKPR